ncbi:MAG: cation:dicarboxylase symporter family transporter [Magnetococcales bacterium]|nr:cation:dicarboxylase symporter family transporter [Magnetococcales bacterium]
MSEKSRFRNFLHFLKSPWAVLVGASCGVYLGLWQEEVVPVIAPLGHAYLSILKMCVLPILVTAISVSLGRLMRSDVSGPYLRRMAIIFMVAMLLTSLVGILSGAVGKPGVDLDQKTMATLGTIIQKEADNPVLEVTLSEQVAKVEGPLSLGSIFLGMLPDNIFYALSVGANMKVLVFALLFGLAAGFIESHSADVLFDLLEAIHRTFEILIRWLIYALPFGLCGLLADQSASVGVEMFLAMTRFVGVAWIAFGVMFVFSGGIVFFRSGQAMATLFRTLRDPAIIAFATGNSLAAIPSTIRAMGEGGLRFEKRSVGLLVPLSVTLCRFGPILYFAVAGIFVSQLYQAQLGLAQMAMVMVGAVLAGMATAGAAGVATLAMLAVVLDPLGLPLDAVLVLFVVVDPVTAPFRSLTNVLTACAVTSLVAKPGFDPNLYSGKNDRRQRATQTKAERRVLNNAKKPDHAQA